MYYCSNLKTINYGGTTTQWESVEKGYDWDISTGTYTVYCSNGNVNK